MEEITLQINGEQETVQIERNWTLLYVLREVLDLTGAKCGCNTGDCGACKVILDGEAVNSCLVLARNVVGKQIETIEGLAKGTQLHPIQQAFIDCGAIQCGYCTPGMILSVKGLLNRNPNPSREEIKEGIAGNLCRCTGYEQIIEAVEYAVEWRRQHEQL